MSKDILKIETLVIGGGMAGLGCARKLADNHRDFLLITENIGGRVKKSQDGNYNYGAMIVTSSHKNVRKWIKLKRKLSKLDIRYYEGEDSKSALHYGLKHPYQFLKLFLLVLKFIGHYHRFQKREQAVSQKRAFEEDGYLLGLYQESASEFIKRHKIEDIAEDVIEPIVYGILISKNDEQTAFNFLLMASLLFGRVYRFDFNFEELIEPFAKRIIQDTVISVTKADDAYLVETRSGKKYLSRHVVLALPIAVSQSLISIGEIKKPRSVDVYHLKGSIKTAFRKGRLKLFRPESRMIGIDNLGDGNYIVGVQEGFKAFDAYFDEYQVIDKMYWKPIYHIIGTQLLDSDVDKNLYVVGDHNVVGMEDAYNTGLYAANRIISNA